MAGKFARITIVAVVVVAGSAAGTVGQDRSRPDSTRDADTGSSVKKVAGDQPDGMAALKNAGEAGKYLFIFFHNGKDQQTQAMRQVFDATMEKVADKAESIVVKTTDRSEKAIVGKFDAKRSPMPMVLAIAPNGAVTGGFPIKFDERLLLEAFVSPSTQQCMKALQDGKLVLLCVHSEKTRFSSEAMRAVQAVKADAKYAKATEIVTVDPTDEAEAVAMKRLQVDTETDEAITLLMAPPGTIINRIKGATNKQALIAAVQKALAGQKKPCCPGGKCAPKKKTGSKTGGKAGDKAGGRPGTSKRKP
jgi:hypothetical protein